MLRALGVKLPRKKVRSLANCGRPRQGQAKFPGLRLADREFEEKDFEDLALPRTLVERCRFLGCSFRNTDLHQSCLAGSDWIDGDFSEAALIGAEVRDCRLAACRFVGAVLIGCDLRGAALEQCDFAGADLTGARINRELKAVLTLTEAQRDLMVDWWSPEDEGPDESDVEE